MKKLIAMLVAFAIFASVPAAAMAQSEPSSWAVSEIDTSAASFLKAVDGEIDYTAGITRRQFAIVALHIYGSMSSVEIPQMSVVNPFNDCDDPLVVTAYGLGLVNGMSDNKFAPDEFLTREQLCVMVSRMAAAFMNVEYYSMFLPELSGFADGDTVSSWAEDAVKLCVMAGIIQGTDKGKLDPQGSCTVEQALIIAKRIKNMQF